MGWMEELEIAKWEFMVFKAFKAFMAFMDAITLCSIKDKGIFNL